MTDTKTLGLEIWADLNYVVNIRNKQICEYFESKYCSVGVFSEFLLQDLDVGAFTMGDNFCGFLL